MNKNKSNQIQMLHKHIEEQDQRIKELEEELQRKPTINKIKEMIHEGYNDLVTENIQLQKENQELEKGIIDYEFQIDAYKEQLKVRKGK